MKEERLHAEKRPVEAGEVTVRKEVHTETKTLEVPVQREEVVIERTPVHGRAATEGIAAGDIREGEEIRIPVREEQVNVSKDAVVTEEVKVGKRMVQDTERVSGQVRKEEVKVEQTGRRGRQDPRHGQGHEPRLTRRGRDRNRQRLPKRKDGGASAPPSSLTHALLAARDVLADDVEQAARLLGVEVGVMTDGEEAFAVPMAILGPVDGVDDDPLEGRPSQEFVDEFLRGEQLKLTRVH